MKATLTMNDDAMSNAERLALQRSVSIDEVVSDLLRLPLPRLSTVCPDNAFLIFPRTPGATYITNEDLRRADEDF